METSEKKAERPKRQAYAAGDGLTRYPSGSPVAPIALRIDSPWEKPWKARVFESLARLQRARSGEPAGSVLGWVLVPFARRLVV